MGTLQDPLNGTPRWNPLGSPSGGHYQGNPLSGNPSCEALQKYPSRLTASEEPLEEHQQGDTIRRTPSGGKLRVFPSGVPPQEAPLKDTLTRNHSGGPTPGPTHEASSGDPLKLTPKNLHTHGFPFMSSPQGASQV
jgi:hypothetical protein